MKKYLIQIILFSLIIFTAQSCKDDNVHNNSGNNNNNTQNVNIENPLNLKIEQAAKRNFFVGDIINVSIDFEQFTKNDSVYLFLNNNQIAVLTKQNSKYAVETKNLKTGTNSIRANVEINKKKFNTTQNIILFSDIKPVDYSYKVIKTYKHDKAAYTQGLFYHKGSFYEATGLKGESTVRKVEPETGDVLQSFAIPSEVFGEGICLFDNKIIQISWQSERGFVYDIESFKLIDEFSYSGEGWGLATDGKKLFMTNGSEKIAVIDPQTYTLIETLEVYDDKNKVVYLNELEYINGEIYANIYQYDKIARIDPETGKVLAYINLKGLLPMNDYRGDTDVLNGIAYDPEQNKIFVTGKKWPKLFEIELVKK